MHIHYAIACISLFGAITIANAQSDPAARYSLRPEHRPFTNNDFAEALSKTSINRSYDQLPAAERQRLRDQYVGMREDDEPPFPRDGLEPLLDAVLRAYGRLAQKQIAGTLDIEVIVDADGNATTVNAYKSPNGQLLSVVASIAMLTKYKPASCEGVPCRMSFPLRLEFVLK